MLYNNKEYDKKYSSIEFSMYYGNIKEYDVSDGPGVRVALYVSGCLHHCRGCHNRDAWDYKYGSKFTSNEIKMILSRLKFEQISGLSILGGEPLDPKNRNDVFSIVEIVKDMCPDKTIWIWTGYTWEEIMKTNIIPKDILEKIDVIVDGKFIQSERNITLKYRGSANQRVIDVKETIKNGSITYYS